MTRSCHSHRPSSRVLRFALLIAMLAILSVGCGPEGYQKPIQQFQDASTTVTNATEALLKSMNSIEQNKELDRIVFEKAPLDLLAIKKIEIISSDEIRVRTEALATLAQYTSNLAQLTQGKAGTAVGESTSKLSASLKNLSSDAKDFPVAKSTILNNQNFSGILSAAATAIGAVAQLIVENKARRAIELSIIDNDAAVTALTQHISDDAKAAYLRRQSSLGQYGDQLSRDYEVELQRNPDPILLLSLADTIKAYRVQESQLVDPSDAITKMNKTHQALVAYLKSHKDPKLLSALVSAAQDFVSATRPLGQASDQCKAKS